MLEYIANHSSTYSLWSNPLNSDVQIECQGVAWLVHRHVLVSVSEWMEKYMPLPQADSNVSPPEAYQAMLNGGTELTTIWHQTETRDMEAQSLEPRYSQRSPEIYVPRG